MNNFIKPSQGATAPARLDFTNTTNPLNEIRLLLNAFITQSKKGLSVSEAENIYSSNNFLSSITKVRSYCGIYFLCEYDEINSSDHSKFREMRFFFRSDQDKSKALRALRLFTSSPSINQEG